MNETTSETTVNIPIEKKMEDTWTQVQPSAQIISYVEIEARVVLHKGMYCLVHAYDSQRVKIKIFQVELSPSEYETWVSDVEMEQLILQKCGLVKV
jgi:methenyltetrahydromethanopterin cyclohydrolase